MLSIEVQYIAMYTNYKTATMYSHPKSSPTLQLGKTPLHCTLPLLLESLIKSQPISRTDRRRLWPVTRAT